MSDFIRNLQNKNNNMYEILKSDRHQTKESYYTRIWYEWDEYDYYIDFLKNFLKDKKYQFKNKWILVNTWDSDSDYFLHLCEIKNWEIWSNIIEILQKNLEYISEHEKFITQNAGKIVMVSDEDYIWLGILDKHEEDEYDAWYSYFKPNGERSINRFGSMKPVSDPEIYKKLFWL